MRISDWSADVCSSDLARLAAVARVSGLPGRAIRTLRPRAVVRWPAVPRDRRGLRLLRLERHANPARGLGIRGAAARRLYELSAVGPAAGSGAAGRRLDALRDPPRRPVLPHLRRKPAGPTQRTRASTAKRGVGKGG